MLYLASPAVQSVAPRCPPARIRAWCPRRTPHVQTPAQSTPLSSTSCSRDRCRTDGFSLSAPTLARSPRSSAAPRSPYPRTLKIIKSCQNKAFCIAKADKPGKTLLRGACLQRSCHRHIAPPCNKQTKQPQNHFFKQSLFIQAHLMGPCSRAYPACALPLLFGAVVVLFSSAASRVCSPVRFCTVPSLPTNSESPRSYASVAVEPSFAGKLSTI
jgi:hypothetical protein